MKQFNICTITNNLQQYEEMKSSFMGAGFNEERCRYTLFDNSKGNVYDPSVFNSVRLSTKEPYIIFCHQDILLNQGDGYSKLIQTLEELDNLDPNWAIAGNAGITKTYKFVARITDPNSHTYPKWGGSPQEVQSLDENFLVIKTAVDISCNLTTFYFYAHDLCLNAMLKGHSCYVIDFHLTHLSPGKFDYDGQSYFNKAIENFQEQWNPKFTFYYYKPVYARTMCFSKYKLLRQIGEIGLQGIKLGMRLGKYYRY